MSHDCALHASSSLNGLARKAVHSPKLLTREEIVLLFEHATEQEKGIAEKVTRNSDDREADELALLGKKELQPWQGVLSCKDDALLGCSASEWRCFQREFCNH